ncbi:MAG: sulfatase-like hydrolase/transferase [Candidatus Hinthialibacter antarcticus]|nr:sulfatase-like hydrolase/transferase [Candidatus Hinthialibacter antarcticus]
MNRPLTRREFIARSSVAASASALLMNPARAADQERPNILWITSEDNGPHMGCYGDSFADTPHLDALAKKSLIYMNAWSTAPVCAPARTTIISGMYPPCTGSEHMRSTSILPSGFKMYPQYLREAGYYCTNNSKEDYNLEKPGQVWDESSGKAHFRNRKENQPFFAIFNFTTTHESQIRKRPHEQVHEPDKVSIPSYHPDTPEVRQDWAQYYDKMTQMDGQAGEILAQLEEDGLADNTIIFYYGDHGSGMPRSKRWPYNSGLHVPMIVHIPEKYKHLRPPDYKTGGSSDRLVGFIDLAQTVLSLAGIQPPTHMQGHAFAGAYTQSPPKLAYGFRGRMDERYDMVRCVRDHRYLYIRNYMPHKVYGQYLAYMFQTPTTRVWKKMYDDGKLEPPQTYFWETKPSEELYDLENDPDEIHNLANSPAHQEIKEKLRQANREHLLKIRDVGFLPEGEIHERKGSTPYEMARDSSKYPIEKIMKAAELASSIEKNEAKNESLANPEEFKAILNNLSDTDSAVRYWGAMGVLMRGKAAVDQAKANLQNALQDESPYVSSIAAEALGRYGSNDDVSKALPVLEKWANIKSHNAFAAMIALNAIIAIGEKADSLKPALAKMERVDPSVPKRTQSYVGRLMLMLVGE